MPPDKELHLKFNNEGKLGRADIYMACSWRPGVGRDAAYLTTKTLDEKGFRVIGDIPDQNFQEESRIKRVMGGCKGFLAVLPYREKKTSRTSEYILEEMMIAKKLEIPIGIFYDSRINIQDITKEYSLDENIFFTKSFQEDLDHLEIEVASEISKFIDEIINTPRYIKDYAFLITSLEEDYSQIRSSIEAAVYQATGLPTLWSDHPLIDSNIKGIRDLTKFMIRDATIIIADLTINKEHPAQESPNRAHEVGIAIAYEKSLFLVSQNPRRYPYFSVNDLQFDFWDDELDLFGKLRERLANKNELFGRRIYNQEMENHNSDYSYKIGNYPDFSIKNEKNMLGPVY